jgi:hypothetical protein
MKARVPFAERGGALRGLLDVATGCYPSFLFGGSMRGVLPVFHFHDVTREWLEPRLQYLVDNGYRTVTSDEIARLALDGVDPGPRSVALTFDDAWTSIWTVATPLLRNYGLGAILFAIPGRVSDAPGPRPVPSLAVPHPAASGGGRSVDDDPFATWPELQAMHDSGVIDIQSHTRSHAMIFSDEVIAGFVTPEYALEPLLNRPVTNGDALSGSGASRASSGQIASVEPAALGTPLFVRRSRMSDACRFFADEQAADRCRDHVARHGGPMFFQRSGWRSELEALLPAVQGRFESEDARKAAIRTELVDGRSLLNERLGTTTVRHVALPWGVAGKTTRRALRDTGHVTAFAERPLKRRGVHAGDDPYQLMRLNGKFLTCLPGRGRQWFFTTVRPAIGNQ